MDKPAEIGTSAALREMLLHALNIADMLDLHVAAIRISEAIDAIDNGYDRVSTDK